MSAVVITGCGSVSAAGIGLESLMESLAQPARRAQNGEGGAGGVPDQLAVLVLTGIVWDSRGHPSAVLDGLPGGGSPRVVRQGDQLGALRVRRIAHDRVVVSGLKIRSIPPPTRKKTSRPACLAITSSPKTSR